MSVNEPLILTLKINEKAQAFFNALRKQYFPAERNYLDAHLTLFHQLPAGEPLVMETLRRVAQSQQTITLSVTEVRNIGNGVAYKIAGNELLQLHKFLQREYQQWLIPQDKQKLWPHITVQNKEEAGAVKALVTELAKQFIPFEITGLGFNLWKYMGGPWEFMETVPFTNQI